MWFSPYGETNSDNSCVMQPSGSGSGSSSGDHTCTTLQNCPRDPVAGLAWTCFLGQTCGFSYRDCNPCPYIGGGSGSSGGSSGSGSSGGGSSTSSSSSSTRTSSSSSSSSSTSFGHRSREARPGLHWLAAVGLGGVLAVAV